jgi:hypothetical protein
MKAWTFFFISLVFLKTHAQTSSSSILLLPTSFNTTNEEEGLSKEEFNDGASYNSNRYTVKGRAAALEATGRNSKENVKKQSLQHYHRHPITQAPSNLANPAKRRKKSRLQWM